MNATLRRVTILKMFLYVSVDVTLLSQEFREKKNTRHVIKNHWANEDFLKNP